MLFGFQLIKKINLSSKAWKITTHFFFILELSLEYAWVFFIYMHNNHYCDSMRTWCYGLFFFVKKLLIYRSITSNLNRIRIKIFLQLSVFSLVFFFADIDDPKYSRKREGIIFISVYPFHLLKNVQTIIHSFSFEMTTYY